jgi:glycosyltransferase involved in cell wall biosynthesis
MTSVVTANRNRRKVLFVESGSGKGGSSMILRYLAGQLDRDRIDPIVAFYTENEGPDTHALQRMSVPIFFLTQEPRRLKLSSSVRENRGSQEIVGPVRAFLRILWRLATTQLLQLYRLARIIRRESVDLVMLNNDLHYHLVGVLAAKLTGVPCICRKAGGIGEGKRLKSILTRWVDLFIAISHATAQDQLTNPGTKRLVLVHSGIDLARFDQKTERPQIRRELNIPPERPVVASISRLSEGKGQREFLQAAARLVQRYPDVHFLVVGDEEPGGALLDELKRFAHDHGLSDHVSFEGWRPDVERVLSVAQVFVHCPTTWIEGLSVAVLEAMAMAKPVVVSANGGLLDAVQDGQTGYIVPAGDIEAMTDRIGFLLLHTDVAVRMGTNARRLVEEEFDIRKNAHRLEQLFLEYAAAHA